MGTFEWSLFTRASCILSYIGGLLAYVCHDLRARSNERKTFAVILYK